MADIAFVRSIGIMIVAAAAIVLLLRRLNIPTIVLYIMAGLLLGPLLGTLESGESAASDAAISSSFSLVTEFGIVLLLFLVGLELSLDKIREIGKVAVIAGIGQVVFTAFFGFFLSLLLGFGAMESIFLATALTFSSTVVVVKLLDQKKDLNTLYGRIAVGIFLVQDLVVIIVLTLLAGLVQTDDASVGAIAWNLGRAFLGTAVLLTIALVAARFILPRPMNWVAPSAEASLIWSLFWCLLFVTIAHQLHLSPEIGAFLAGISLAQLPVSHDVRRRLHPLMNFFIAIFFISLGANMEFGDAAANWFPSAVLAIFVLLGNPFIFMWIIARCGYGERTSFFTSVTVAQISEFSFIFVGVGLVNGLIGQSVVTVTTIVGLVTIAASAYMILYSDWLYAQAKRWGLLRMFRASDVVEEERIAEVHGHIVVVGMNAMGRHIAQRLHEAGQEVLAIDTDPRKLRRLPCRTLIGNIDYLEVVEEAGLSRAKFAISALQIEDANNLLAHRCAEYGVPIAVHAFDRSVFDDLRRLNVAYLIDSKAEGSMQLITALEEQGVVAT